MQDSVFGFVVLSKNLLSPLLYILFLDFMFSENLQSLWLSAITLAVL